MFYRIFVFSLLQGFFYRIQENDGTEIDNIARHLHQLDEENDIAELDYTFSLSSLIGNVNTERFYTYRGNSLIKLNSVSNLIWT